MFRINGRIAFDHYIGKPDPKGNKYSVKFLFDAENKKIIDKAIADWKKENPAKARLRAFINSGTEKKPEDECYAGMWYINPKSGRPISLANRAGQKVPPERVSELFYSGVNATLFFTIFESKAIENPGICFGLSGLQSHETGERMVSYAEPEFAALPPIDVAEEDLSY